MEFEVDLDGRISGESKIEPEEGNTDCGVQVKRRARRSKPILLLDGVNILTPLE